MKDSAKIVQSREFGGEIADPSYFRNCKNGTEHTWYWPKEIGEGYLHAIKLRQGLVMGIFRYNIYRHISAHFEKIQLPISIGFCVNGSNTVYYNKGKISKSELSFKTDYGFICYQTEGHGSSCCSVTGIPVHFLVLYIDPVILHDLLEECVDQVSPDLRALLCGDDSISYLKPFPITSAINTAVHQVFNCSYQGSLKRLHMEGKALELITHAFAQLDITKTEKAGCRSLHSYEIDRIRQAGHILEENLTNPPSLVDLARQVGVSRDKLNRDFRQVYGTSVFKYLRISRLERARKLLESRGKNVTEVAFDVGYAHPKNFARAFKSHFGASPREYLR